MAQNFLEVKLVFWRYETRTAIDRNDIDRKISKAITSLCNNNDRSWRYGDTDEFTGADGDTKLCVRRIALLVQRGPSSLHLLTSMTQVTIQHNDLKTEDPRVESAVEKLCQILFLEKSVLALDPILADGRFLMGPFSETSMIATDRIFGINFARENLAQLQRTGGLGATMQEKMRQSDQFMGRNASKWFHAP
jgi:hypothetical protein